MANTKKTELLVIGAGPGGYPAAFHAADHGMKVTLVDPEANPGGTCLFRGCIPSKALLHIAAFLHETELASECGVAVNKPKVHLNKLRSWKHSVVTKLTGGVGQLVKSRKIEYVRGLARLKDAHHATLSPEDGDDYELAFDHAIIATGSRAATIPGLPDSSRVMTSREALDLPEIPKRLLVVGAGYVGLELGQVYAALGARVTMVELLPDILPGADRDLVRVLSHRLDRQFENIMLETKVKELKETKTGLRVVFEGKHSDKATFDRVLVAVGRKPVPPEFELEMTEDGFIAVDAQRRTSEPSLFAIGDVAGEPMLAHKATHEARVAVEAIAGNKSTFEPNAIPFVVFTDPEIAWCGLSHTNAREKGIEVKALTFPWTASGRAATLSRQDGLTKLLTHPADGRILGVGIVGHNAGELLAEGVLAMEMGAVAEDLALTIHTHPTLSETVMEAAESFGEQSTHFRKK